MGATGSTVSNTYIRNYIKNSSWLQNVDSETRQRNIDNIRSLPLEQQWYYSLTDDERGDIVSMQTDTHMVNEYLRGVYKPPTDTIKKILDDRITNLTSALNQYIMDSDVVLYRGINLDEYFDTFDGTHTTSFKSASTDPKIAELFARNQGGYIIEYHISKGTRNVANVNGAPMANESEYLIGNNVRYKKVIPVSDKNKIIIYI